MRKVLVSVCLMLLAASIAAAGEEPAVTLKVGDAAPKLQTGKWVKGEPIKELEKGKTYIVEFWATWCGPCRQTIPHLSQLQTKYPDIVFIGQNVWERDEAAVAPFVQQMGEKMSYRVAMDDKSKSERGAMAETWMQAAGQNGIPAAFLVDKEGKIAWIGHPMELDRVLEKVAAGTFDPKVEAAEREKAEAAAREQQKIFQGLATAMRNQEWDKALAATDEIAKVGGERGAMVATAYRFQILIRKKDYKAAYAMGDKLLETFKDTPAALNQFAWVIATEKEIEQRDLDLAERLAKRAVEATGGNEAAILDTLARVYFEKGEIDKAIETETQALAKASDESKEEMTASLNRYKEKKNAK